MKIERFVKIKNMANLVNWRFLRPYTPNPKYFNEEYTGLLLEQSRLGSDPIDNYTVFKNLFICKNIPAYNFYERIFEAPQATPKETNVYLGITLYPIRILFYITDSSLRSNIIKLL